MSEVERYIRRATHGLWGGRKRIVEQEVRGALEDRIWKHRVAGCDHAEATSRAIADLGDPRVIAGGMARVHALPVALQLTVLTALAGTLALTVQQQHRQTVDFSVVAAPYSPALLTCDYSPAGLDQLKTALGADWPHFKLPAGKTVAEQEAQCRSVRGSLYQYLDYGSLLAGLRAAGVQVTPQLPAGQLSTIRPEDAAQFVDQWLSFPGSKVSVPLWKVPAQSGRHLIPTAWVVASVTQANLPVTVEGEINPTLHIGQTSLRLGTKDTPVMANDFISYALYPKLSALVNGTIATRGLNLPLLSVIGDPRSSQALMGYAVKTLNVNLPEQTAVGVLIHRRPNQAPFAPVQDVYYTTRVQNGQILIPVAKEQDALRVTDSLRELMRVFEEGDPAGRVLLLKLSASARLDQLGYDFYGSNVVQP